MKLNKKQKRTATIASMAALLAVVLGMGGQTFAKYIETNTMDTQTATVAKFGLNVQTQVDAQGNEMTAFKNSYNDAIKANVPVVAPGATGSITYVVNGSAEVDATIDFEVTDYVGVELSYDGKTYNPIVWWIEGAENNKVTNPSSLSFSTLEYDAGQSVSGLTFTLHWEWPFEGTAEKVVDGLNGNEMDTVLGQIAVDYAASATTITKAVDGEGEEIENQGSYEVSAGKKYDFKLGVQFAAVATITQSETDVAA